MERVGPFHLAAVGYDGAPVLDVARHGLTASEAGEAVAEILASRHDVVVVYALTETMLASMAELDPAESARYRETFVATLGARPVRQQGQSRPFDDE